jgi:cytochrome d ubiquinol oxidase subunit I
VFWAFRVMVGVGLLMLATSWLAAWQLRRRGEPAPWMARALVGMTFSGWVATLAGWYVTEIGRQPRLVTGVLRTADAASDTPAPIIGISLTAYLAIYIALLLAYVSVLFHLARKGGATVAAPITAVRGEPDET